MFFIEESLNWITRSLSFRLVLETLSPLPADRKCFRMINGVLVERTVKDVKPALETNSEGLKKVLEELLKQYKKQQEEMEKWKVSLCFWEKIYIHSDINPCTEKEQYSGCTAIKRWLFHAWNQVTHRRCVWRPNSRYNPCYITVIAVRANVVAENPPLSAQGLEIKGIPKEATW